MMNGFAYEELEAATESFSPTRIIGKGSHGCVYKGVLRDGQTVAVKKQSSGLEMLQDNSKLENEAFILSSLITTLPKPNPYLIAILGTTHDPAGNKILVMEHMPNGTLHHLLHHPEQQPPPPWPKRLQIAIRVAKAVQSLHEAKPSPIVHRDIKSANILFDSDWNPKLADFGLAVRLMINYANPPAAGTIGYLDPCYTEPGKLSTKNDVFSFGVVLLEIISGSKVIDVSRSPAAIVEWALPLIEDEKTMLEICDKRVEEVPWYMESTMKHMLRVAARCVSTNEEDRPSIAETVVEMETSSTPLMSSAALLGGVEPPLRFPLWMVNVLRSLVLKKRKRRKITATAAANSTIANGNAVDFPKGKLLVISEILADNKY